MHEPSQGGQKARPALPTVQFGWRWALICGAATLICYFSGLRELSYVLFLVTIVLGTIAEISSRFTLSLREQSPDPLDTSPEEFYIHFPDPAESGWHNYTVTPSKNIYKEEFCDGGLPNVISKYEYSIRVDQVFGRLVDLREEDLNTVQYEVVNGEVREAEIRSRNPYDYIVEYIESLKKDVTWNEITGSLRYFILSIHGCERSFFSREQQRLEKGFASLAKKAAQLGGVRKPGGHYKPMNDADEQSKAAIRELQHTASLERFGISLGELRFYEHIIQTLEGLISGSDDAR
jgi:hypothetical protein